MKVLHYINCYDQKLGGVVQFVSSLCQNLINNNVQTTLVIGLNVDLNKKWINPTGSNKLNVHILESKIGYKFRLTKKNMIELNQFLVDCDVVHFHGAWDIGNIQLSKIVKKLKKQYIVSPHGMLTDWSLNQKKLKKLLFLFFFGNKFFKDAYTIHCTSAKELNQTKNNIPHIDKFICVPPIVYQDKDVNPKIVFNAFPDISKSAFKILFVGRIHSVKGIETLIESCVELKKHNKKFQVIIAGAGDENYENELKKMVNSKNISKEIIWTGMLRNPLKDSLFNACQLFVLPSLHESFGIALAEAGLAGLSIITTKHVGVHEELKNGGAVILPINPKKIAKVIKKFIQDYNPTESNEQSQEYYNDWLNIDSTLEKFVNVYKAASQK